MTLSSLWLQNQKLTLWNVLINGCAVGLPKIRIRFDNSINNNGQIWGKIENGITAINKNVLY